jgi:mRNA-degrading endonuclease RelE of RelBE toxin-antitoxin system
VSKGPAVRSPPEVQETIRHLHPDLKRQVRAAIDLLRAPPESGKALKAELEGWRSLRVGGFRIVYRSSRASIDVAAIGPRASIYLEAARLARRARR